MRTYLVTGGAGFIGSNYIHYMLKKYGEEIRIINVDALTYAGNLENLKDIENLPNYTFVNWTYQGVVFNPGDAIPTGWGSFISVTDILLAGIREIDLMIQ